MPMDLTLSGLLRPRALAGDPRRHRYDEAEGTRRRAGPDPEWTRAAALAPFGLRPRGCGSA